MFLGSYVNIVLRGIRGYDTRSKISNLTIAGLLLDESDDCVYLGTPDEVTTAIDKDVIGVVLAESIEVDEPSIPPGTIQQ